MATITDEWPRMEGGGLEESELYFFRYWWNKRNESIDPKFFTKQIKAEIMQRIIEKIDHVSAWKIMAWEMPDMVKIIPEGERIISFLFSIINDDDKSYDGSSNRIL